MTEPETFYLGGAQPFVQPRQIITWAMVDEALRTWHRVPKGQLREFDEDERARMQQALTCDRLSTAVDVLYGEPHFTRKRGEPGYHADCAGCLTRMALCFEDAEYARKREIANATAQYEQLEDEQ